MEENFNDQFINLIYHEKQDASLCGLHAINNLLQKKMVEPEDLSQIAIDLDKQEEQMMLENGKDSFQYKEYLKVFILYNQNRGKL
jgi:3-hydroxymyristoyl/3-hydroxydecanoyl-(acyl carrier protein) dehydratase